MRLRDGGRGNWLQLYVYYIIVKGRVSWTGLDSIRAVTPGIRRIKGLEWPTSRTSKTFCGRAYRAIIQSMRNSFMSRRDAVLPF